MKVASIAVLKVSYCSDIFVYGGCGFHYSSLSYVSTGTGLASQLSVSLNTSTVISCLYFPIDPVEIRCETV